MTACDRHRELNRSFTMSTSIDLEEREGLIFWLLYSSDFVVLIIKKLVLSLFR